MLVGGLPGTGKSTLAAAVGRAIGAVVLRSDEIRHELARQAVSCSDLYSDSMTQATYDRLLEMSRRSLEMGGSVILDASWTHERHRAAARALAGITRSEPVELCCTAPSETSERRIEERRLRGDDISDATIQVARAMSAAADPWPSSTEIDTSLAPDDSLVAALSVLDKEPPLASRVLRTP